MRSQPVGRRAARGEVISYGDGRECAKPGCTTRLSRYNSTSYCAWHDHAEARFKKRLW